MVEWVEVRGKTIDVAVAAAMNELGVGDRSQVDVEVVQEPEKGFLGLGGRDAIVRVKPKPTNRRGGRNRGRASGASGTSRQGGRDGAATRDPNRRPGPRPADSPRSRPGSASTGGSRMADGPRGGRSGYDRPRPERSPRRDRPPADVDPHQQAPAVEQFLVGLVGAFGLEGSVRIGVEDDVVIAEIDGEQTEAMVGPRGSVMEAIHEITKTVLHRQFVDTARVRIDIAGYAERRRQALSIYAKQLIEQVRREGGEIMLEPMSAADRKVIHDSVGEIDGVVSYSEGEPPRRYVVIASGEGKAEGVPTEEAELTD
ncbi:MAG: RNA-binding cell elongation regulator Jag/EloR [Acidimicrobiia bacterium]